MSQPARNPVAGIQMKQRACKEQFDYLVIFGFEFAVFKHRYWNTVQSGK